MQMLEHVFRMRFRIVSLQLYQQPVLHALMDIIKDQIICATPVKPIVSFVRPDSPAQPAHWPTTSTPQPTAAFKPQATA